MYVSEHNALPISRFQPRPLAEHPPGTLLIIAAWSSEPAELCLAVKLSGLTDRNNPIESALVIQGSPYGGSENCAGDIVSDVGDGARYVGGSLLGLRGSTLVVVRHELQWDLSQQRSWRGVRGCAVLGAFGMRICGGGGDVQRISSWGVAIDTATWEVNEEDSKAQISGVASEWTFICQDGDRDVMIPVQAGSFRVIK